MKNMKKMISALLALVLVLSLAGCGSSEKDKLVGKWSADMELADMINAEIAQGLDEEMSDYIQISSFKLTMVMTLREDGTYSLELDENSIPNMLEGMKEDLKDGLKRYFEDAIAAEGVDMSVDALLALSGTTLDALVDEAFSENFSQELINEMVGGLTEEGDYNVKNGKLYMTTGTGSSKNTQYEEYVLSGDTLTMPGSGDEDGMIGNFYPLVFTRIG